MDQAQPAVKRLKRRKRGNPDKARAYSSGDYQLDDRSTVYILSRMFESDGEITKDQFYGSRSRSRIDILPEVKLVLAVLEDAIFGTVPDAQWIKSTDDEREGLFTFETCCWILGLDPQAVRKAVLPRIELENARRLERRRHKQELGLTGKKRSWLKAYERGW